MKDFVFTVRLSVDDSKDNKDKIAAFSQWLNEGSSKTSWNYHAQQFIDGILRAAEIPFDGLMETRFNTSAEDNILDQPLRPRRGQGGKWYLADLPLRNGAKIWVKLENQYIKGHIEVSGKDTFINVLPEETRLLMSGRLLLKWN